MDIFDAIILFMIILILYIYFIYGKSPQPKEQFYPSKFNVKIDSDNYESELNTDNYGNNSYTCSGDSEMCSSDSDTNDNKSYKQQTNPNFIEMQFHNDYRDTLNAIDLLLPTQKKLFNTTELPVTSSIQPSGTEIKDLINSFIEEINETVRRRVANEVTLTNWNNNLAEKKFESGWEKQQKKLGLPGSIYVDPAPKAPIKLIKIENAKKNETSDELQFVMFLVVQKKNVKDQMILKISFVISKTDWDLERDFFNEKKNTGNTDVKLETIDVIGYLTNNDNGKKKSAREEFYKFDSFEGNNLFNTKDVVKELNKKKRLYDAEFAKQSAQ